MVEIRSREDLEEWLEDRPNTWAQILTVRTALRGLPFGFLARQSEGDYNNYCLGIFRTLCMAWASNNWPSRNMHYAALVAVQELTNTVGLMRRSDRSIYDASVDLAYATYSAGYFEFGVVNAGDAIAAVADAGEIYDLSFAALIWQAVSDDCNWLLSQRDQRKAAGALAYQSLWRGRDLAAWESIRLRALHSVNELDISFSVWVEWYDGRIVGRRSSFYIPGDVYEIEDAPILARLSSQSDEDFWGKGAYFVNTTLQSWIDEARARAVPPDSSAPDPEAISAKLLESASPQARIVDGKLDAVPNALFDAPQYSDNLADLPTEMQAFLAVLELSLPRNCPSVIRNCIKGYADELLVRGNRPIVNILTGMASAITAQFWLIGPGADQQEPETWQVRHPEEWDSGTADLFRTFFKKHRDLITHFPLNVEREELIAATRIDEVKASGATLLDPIQAVNDLIIGLNKDGLATDNIMQIMDAHLRYARSC